MNTPVKENLLELLDHLNHGLVERDSTLKAALLTMLAGENLLLVGPPGTAKSLIARKVAECLAHDGGAKHAGGYFEYLLTKFSTPEEIFGPLSISELKADRFKRNTAGYLPSVRMAFLDEIFKASSSILNALLTILNERLYHNGSEAQKVPLQALIAASNELPTGQEELDALYDRFLVRSFVDYVSEENLPRLLDKPGPAPTITPLSTADLTAIRQAAEAVTLPADILSAIQKIWAGHKQLFKEDRRENLSDRRLRKVVGLLCVSAATNGRQQVDLSDLLLLKDCLWNHPDNALKVRELVMNALRAFSRPVPLSDAENQPATQQKNIDSKPIAKMGAVVKGYKGSGTEHDPILIENLQDLAGLERPEVGQQGYWFRQTANIDAHDLTTWIQADFQGGYDGGGHTISHSGAYLFRCVRSKSNISNIRLHGLGLAKILGGSEISACKSDVQLFDSASDCSISYCQSGGVFMTSAIKCTISHCQSGNYFVSNGIKDSSIHLCRSEHALIAHSADNCTIRDCEIRVNGRFISELAIFESSAGFSGFGGRAKLVGGIAVRLDTGTKVERCFVTGSGAWGSENFAFHGLAVEVASSAIRQCIFGAFEPGENVSLRNRIVSKWESQTTLKDNVALDCHPGDSQHNGADGKSLSKKLFTQHYCEHTLGWDFANVWQWNDAESQPELRAVGVDAVQQQQSAEPQGDTGDLLQQQLNANLWL